MENARKRGSDRRHIKEGNRAMKERGRGSWGTYQEGAIREHGHVSREKDRNMGIIREKEYIQGGEE